MAKEKDIAEKIFFDIDEVFADILNVLLFGGKELISPDALAPTGQRSQLKIGREIHEQERDVSKLWMKGRVRFALLGLENQTEIERDMVMRTFSYDGASYKEQIVNRRKKGVKHWVPYPSITSVLYFGKKRWNGPKTLFELLGDNLPDELRPFASDYKLNVFEIAFLSPETVRMFKSDFRIVADYFVQNRVNRDYIPSADTITHVEEMLKLMSALTKDRRFEDSINDLVRKEGGVTMCEVLDRVEMRGIEKGRLEGRLEGHAEGRRKGRAEGRKEGRMEGRTEGRDAGILAVCDAFSKDELARRFHVTPGYIENLLKEKGLLSS